VGKINIENITKAANKAAQSAYELKLVPKRQQIRCDQIEYHPKNRFAKHDDEQSIRDLADDIENNGLISPIAVNDRGGVYRLLSGERRFRATLLLHKEVVDCNVYYHLDNATEMRILYAANLEVRKYSSSEILTFYKEFYAVLKRQIDSGQYNGNINEEISKVMKITDRQVRKYARIREELTEEEQQAIVKNQISINDADKIAALRATKRKTELVPLLMRE